MSKWMCFDIVVMITIYSKERQMRCKPCEPGYYSNDTGAVVCVGCPPGKMCNLVITLLNNKINDHCTKKQDSIM